MHSNSQRWPSPGATRRPLPAGGARYERSPTPSTSCFSDAVAGFLAPAPTTRTGSPSARPSGGAVMMRSSAATPEASSISLPRSRAIVTVLNSTLSSGPTVATRRPFWLKISALAGMCSGMVSRCRLRRHIGVAARHQLAGGIIQRQLHPRGARGDIDRLRRGLHRRRKVAVRIFRHRDRGLGADLDRRHVVLGNVDIDAQLGDVGDHEHRRARAAAGIDQRADVGVARGDDAVERHGDLLVAGQRLEPLDIGLAGIDRGLLVGEVGGALVDFLRRDEVGRDQRLAPRQRRFRQSGAGLLAGEIGAGLQQLLVEVRAPRSRRSPGPP